MERKAGILKKPGCLGEKVTHVKGVERLLKKYGLEPEEHIIARIAKLNKKGCKI